MQLAERCELLAGGLAPLIEKSRRWKSLTRLGAFYFLGAALITAIDFYPQGIHRADWPMGVVIVLDLLASLLDFYFYRRFARHERCARVAYRSFAALSGGYATPSAIEHHLDQATAALDRF